MPFDRQHVFVVTYNYAFSFFRGKQGVISTVLGGSELDGITRPQTSEPLTITASQELGKFNFTRLDDMTPGAPLFSGYTYPSASKCWFNLGVVKGTIAQETINNTPAFLTASPAAKTGRFNRPGETPKGNVIGRVLQLGYVHTQTLHASSIRHESAVSDGFLPCLQSGELGQSWDKCEHGSRHHHHLTTTASDAIRIEISLLNGSGFRYTLQELQTMTLREWHELAITIGPNSEPEINGSARWRHAWRLWMTKVLVVDDCASVMNSLVLVLRKAGFTPWEN